MASGIASHRLLQAEAELPLSCIDLQSKQERLNPLDLKASTSRPLAIARKWLNHLLLLTMLSLTHIGV